MHNEETGGILPDSYTTWRAFCVGCGKSSEIFWSRNAVVQWREQHRLEDRFPSDIVIERLFRGPGGGDIRVFEQL